VSVPEPFPELEEILASIGAAGTRVAAMDAGEGGAGNISACIGWPIEVRGRFPVVDRIELPLPARHLAGHRIVVTGSGRRLRDIAADPAANLGVVVVEEGGETGLLHTAPGRLFE
jgi:rhamnulose-1-phosphate aldolase